MNKRESGRPARKVAATTVDFFDTLPASGKLAWARSDTAEMVRRVRDAGCDLFYLRLSNGRAYWPSDVLDVYADCGMNEYSAALEQVVRDRDMLAEFVALTHEHGMRAVYWVPIYDDETTMFNFVDAPDKAERYGLFPLQSNFGRRHPELYWEHRDAWKYPRDQDAPGDIMPNGRRRWWGGNPEYLDPAARQYRLDLCRELTEQCDVDGVCYTLRSHSWWGDYQPLQGDVVYEYGFNDAVVAAYAERYGVDIRSEEFDRAAWAALRGEGLTALVRETFEYLDGSGREFHMMINPGPGLGVDDMHYLQEQRQMFWGKVDLDWRTWVKNGWMHAAVLYGTWPKDRYGPAWQAVAREVRREIGARQLPVYLQYRCVEAAEAVGPFREDFPRIFGDDNLDGVIIYEADDFIWGDSTDSCSLHGVIRDLLCSR